MPGKAAAAALTAWATDSEWSSRPCAKALVVLRGRRLAEALPDSRLGGEEELEQGAQLRVLDRVEQVAEPRLEPLDRHGRAFDQVGPLVLAFERAAHRVDRDLRAVARMDREPALDQHDLARSGAVEATVDVLPGDRLDGAARVGHDQPKKSSPLRRERRLRSAPRRRP